jgi:putative SOS response-associated peptidase YedK
MCGRFTITVDRVDTILRRFSAEMAPGYAGMRPMYNAAPGQIVPALVTNAEGKRFLTGVFWGISTPWNENEKNTFQANIRDDTIRRNSFFRGHLLHNRCAFIVDGFYEWQKPEEYTKLARGEKLPKGVRKTPFRIHFDDNRLFLLAGLWRTIKGEDGPIVTAGIITTSPNEVVKPIHDRMPVILSEDGLNLWLDRRIEVFDTIYPLLAPHPPEQMTAYPVSDAVNNSRVDLPALIDPL